MLIPIRIGHAPINKNVGGSHGIRPKKLKIEVATQKETGKAV